MEVEFITFVTHLILDFYLFITIQGSKASSFISIVYILRYVDSGDWRGEMGIKLQA